MNVVIVSECDKRALTETRRILDQFAERRGERTWQTAITQAGLDTLRKMLRRTARKNTAVACHRIRGVDHTELAWIVGDASRFNELGAVPTNTTGSDILRKSRENDWHTAEDIRLLAEMAALFHDFGKSSLAFQKKLKTSTKPLADAYRHEWISLRLFEAFVAGKSDEDWLQRLARSEVEDSKVLLERVLRDDIGHPNSPFSPGNLPALAKIVGWLVVSHHQLPTPAARVPVSKLASLPAPIDASWNRARGDASSTEKAACWDFPKGLPFDSRSFLSRAARVAQLILARPEMLSRAEELGDDPFVTHLARLGLMLADHYYSGLPTDPQLGDKKFPLFANTDRETGKVKQRLDEHLIGVAKNTRKIIRILPRLEQALPRIARHRGFQRRSGSERFRWQDRAFDISSAIRERAQASGFFGINMASTGCGKTLANGRIMYALADPRKGARFSVALGLRTLTLQTGEAYRERIGLEEEDLGVLVGGGPVRELFELNQLELGRVKGSESSEALLSDTSYVHFEGSLADNPLGEWLEKDSNASRLLLAPVLVSTIDHLIPATEGTRGGRQIAPILRLMTSDLVLDEPDDFDVKDLPALSRLVHWAGMLGSRVLLSSATLPPAIVEGLFAAYRAGRRVFDRNRGAFRGEPPIECAWFDEFRSEAHACHRPEEFSNHHELFVEQRIRKLRSEQPRRTLKIGVVPSAPDPTQLTSTIVAFLRERAFSLHRDNHIVDPVTKKRVSFGLIRFANVDPLIDVARYWYEDGTTVPFRAALCVYHARFPLLLRAAIERMLDRVLRRDERNVTAILKDPTVREVLDTHPENDFLFIILASPVAEVGRDHDYDWAIVDPSSARSLIQLAGRVRRHRPAPHEEANIVVMHRNLRSLRGERICFVKPGFEGDGLELETHDLRELFTAEQIQPLDAVPRIRRTRGLEPRRNLVALEHEQLSRLMLRHEEPTRPTVPVWWETKAWLSGELQQAQRFRASETKETFALAIESDEDPSPSFYKKAESRRAAPWVLQNALLKELRLATHPAVSVWATGDYVTELEGLATLRSISLREASFRYGQIELRPSVNGWSFHPHLGFIQER